MDKLIKNKLKNFSGQPWSSIASHLDQTNPSGGKTNKLVLLKTFAGQPWSSLTNHLDHTTNPADSADDAGDSDVEADSHSLRLSREDMAIFGCCPIAEVFELAVCNYCGDKFKMPALAEHIRLRHEDGKCSALKIDDYHDKKYAVQALQSKKNRGRQKKANAKQDNKLTEHSNIKELIIGKQLEQPIDVKLVLRESISTSSPVRIPTPSTPSQLSPSTSILTQNSTPASTPTPSVTPTSTPSVTPTITPTSTPVKGSPDPSKTNSTPTNTHNEFKLKQSKHKVKKTKVPEKLGSSSEKMSKHLNVLPSSSTSKFKDKTKEQSSKKPIVKAESLSPSAESSSSKETDLDPSAPPADPNMQPVVQLSPLGGIAKSNSIVEPKKKMKLDKKPSSMRDRTYNPDKHCGVVSGKENTKPCTRSLTCKSHSMTLRRAVKGRSKAFDILLADHRAEKELLRKRHVSVQITNDGDRSNDSTVNIKIVADKQAVTSSHKVEICDKSKLIKGTTLPEYSKLSLPVSIKNPSLFKQIPIVHDDDDKKSSQSPDNTQEDFHQSLPEEGSQLNVASNEQLQKSQVQQLLSQQEKQNQPQQLLNVKSSQHAPQMHVLNIPKQLQQMQFNQKLQTQQGSLKVLPQPSQPNQITQQTGQQMAQIKQTQQPPPQAQPTQQLKQLIQQQSQPQQAVMQKQQKQILQKQQQNQFQKQQPNQILKPVATHQNQKLQQQQQHLLQQFRPIISNNLVPNNNADFRTQVRNVILFRTSKENGREIGVSRSPGSINTPNTKAAPLRTVLPSPIIQSSPQPPTPPPQRAQSDCEGCCESDREEQEEIIPDSNTYPSLIEWWQPGFKRSRGLLVSKPHKRAKFRHRSSALQSSDSLNAEEFTKSNNLLMALTHNSNVLKQPDRNIIVQMPPAELEQRPKPIQNFFLYNNAGKMKKSEIPTNLVGPVVAPTANFTPVVHLALTTGIPGSVVPIHASSIEGGKSNKLVLLKNFAGQPWSSITNHVDHTNSTTNSTPYKTILPTDALTLGHPGQHYITASGPFQIGARQQPTLIQQMNLKQIPGSFPVIPSVPPAEVVFLKRTPIQPPHHHCQRYASINHH